LKIMYLFELNFIKLDIMFIHTPVVQ